MADFTAGERPDADGRRTLTANTDRAVLHLREEGHLRRRQRRDDKTVVLPQIELDPLLDRIEDSGLSWD